MMQGQYYLLDSDVLITAKNRYYAFDICPGFWESLIEHHQEGRIFSISWVRSELLRGQRNEELVQWVKQEVPNDFFLHESSNKVIGVYKKIMTWVKNHLNYTDQVCANFANSADGWLVAFSQVHNAIVVTNEKSAPASKNVVKLPDICRQFNVPQKDTFGMLRSLEVRFDRGVKKE